MGKNNTGRHGKRGGCWPVPVAIVAIIAVVGACGAGCELRSRDGNTPVNCVRVAQSGEPARAPHLSTPSVEPCS